MESAQLCGCWKPGRDSTLLFFRNYFIVLVTLWLGTKTNLSQHLTRYYNVSGRKLSGLTSPMCGCIRCLCSHLKWSQFLLLNQHFSYCYVTFNIITKRTFTKIYGWYVWILRIIHTVHLNKTRSRPDNYHSSSYWSVFPVPLFLPLTFVTPD